MNHREARALSNEKRKLREAMLARRMQLPHAAMLSASGSVARHFADHPILAFAPSFAGYRAMRGELDVMEIFRVMARFEKQTALPCVTPEKSLIYRAWKLADPLTRHPLGMEEPVAEADIITPAVILCPLLAFDGEGYRLGYGGGYYDRTMEALRNPSPRREEDGRGAAQAHSSSKITLAAGRISPHPNPPPAGEGIPLFIGVGFSMQEVDLVPTDDRDAPLDGVLTELGVSMF